MELLSTVGWLLFKESSEPTVEGIQAGLTNWGEGGQAAQRKIRLFDERLIELALKQLSPLYAVRA